MTDIEERFLTPSQWQRSSSFSCRDSICTSTPNTVCRQEERVLYICTGSGRFVMVGRELLQHEDLHGKFTSHITSLVTRFAVSQTASGINGRPSLAGSIIKILARLGAFGLMRTSFDLFTEAYIGILKSIKRGLESDK
jgi:hypothetical protein